MKKLIFLANILVLAIPFIALADSSGATTIKDIIIDATSIVKLVINLLMPLALAVFLWGVVKYIFSSGDEEKRKTAKDYIIYGLIGLFVLVAFVGIINVVASTLGVSTGGWFGSLVPQSSPPDTGGADYVPGPYPHD